MGSGRGHLRRAHARGELVWWYRPAGGSDAYRNEMAREQEFEDFIANGASVAAPADVERRLRELIGPKPGS